MKSIISWYLIVFVDLKCSTLYLIMYVAYHYFKFRGILLSALYILLHKTIYTIMLFM